MIDPSRIQAAIEILEQVASSLSDDGPSADVLIRKYFRTRRYAGAKDRRFVTDRVYQIIRDWGFLNEAAAGDIRRMMLLALGDADLFTGQAHAPATITDAEKQFLSDTHEKKSHHIQNYPLWLEDRLQQRFPDNFAAELESLNGRAPFELRVNLGKTTVARVEDYLRSEGIDYHKGKWAETALILADNPRIDAWEIYKSGQVEIQDEAAQLAVEISDFKPGQQVMDLCAGAGGKTLAAAAYMENKGQIYAFDNNFRRLKDLKPRAKKADVRILQSRHVDTAGGKRQKILSEYVGYKGGASHASGGAQVAEGGSPSNQAKEGGASHTSGGSSSSELANDSSPHQTEKGYMDRVIVDVPCSGSGVWRRNPELKWRLDEETLRKYCRIQKNLLAEAWAFVKPGGRMIYMTCSLFQDENETQVTAFLAGHGDAKLVPYTDFYQQAELKTLSSLPFCLALSPFTHGTDGFFVAILEKIA